MPTCLILLVLSVLPDMHPVKHILHDFTLYLSWSVIAFAVFGGMADIRPDITEPCDSTKYHCIKR